MTFWANPTSMNGNEEQELESPSLPPRQQERRLTPFFRVAVQVVRPLAITAYEQPVVK